MGTQILPDYMFTGKELDTETGLYYFGARYYDSRVSLWESPDPILGAFLDGKPNGGVYNTFNLASYNYVSQNPLRLIDPDGRFAVWDDAVVMAGGAVLGVASKGLEDFVAGKSSGFRAYAAAAAGGAVGAEVAYTVTVATGGNLVAGKIAGGAAGGALGNIVEQVANGKVGKDFSWKDVGQDAALGAGGELLNKIKVVNKVAEKIGKLASPLGRELETKGEEGLINVLKSKRTAAAFLGASAAKGVLPTAEGASLKGAGRRVENK